MKAKIPNLFVLPCMVMASLAAAQEVAPIAPPPGAPPLAAPPVPGTPPAVGGPVAPPPAPPVGALVAPPSPPVGGPVAPPPPPAGAPIPPPPPAPVSQEVTAIDGAVRQVLMNPDGEVDGLLLADGVQVKFPPHLGGDLARIAKANDKVHVQGVRESERVIRGTTITNLDGMASVTDAVTAGQAPPPAPPSGNRKLLQADGKVRATLFAPRGEPEGAVLENGSILRMPPHVAAQYSSLLQAGASITARGFGTENQFGRSLEVTEIGAPGQPPNAIYNAPSPAPPVPPQARP
jgi:hypothetical protein